MEDDEVRLPSRPYGSDVGASDYVAILLKRLDELARRSDPRGGEQTQHGKDHAAFEALEVASQLTEAVAGWAIRHQIGLAMQGLSFVPLGPVQIRSSPDYLVARQEVDRHEHEANGASVDSLPPTALRQALINIIHAQTHMPHVVREPVIHALEALDRGDTQPVFEPQTANGKGLSAKRSFQARKLVLKALGFVTYRAKLYGKKGDAELEVVEAYGLLPVSWTPRLGVS